jgi:hypothetical protein
MIILHTQQWQGSLTVLKCLCWYGLTLIIFFLIEYFISAGSFQTPNIFNFWMPGWPWKRIKKQYKFKIMKDFI